MNGSGKVRLVLTLVGAWSVDAKTLSIGFGEWVAVEIMTAVCHVFPNSGYAGQIYDRFLGPGS